ncbi:type II toxin-antitoxin system HicB family antitoxin [Campylobacter gastrosuis]|uniref:Type II toxin-antitoxin system HicB family antitoxin n=1 Tax=Campylobacter gastrosuis TaxID=2974576 RepID=A0ABT7HQA4_9BACT|nr:type II toxin-antitoxin system HicB family antitoxin [Campylobacter gastrosuis]MDL0088613.1 type II toxin-antitoxin system HicB family antitoxin [Campylobacter gastrosuis]
MKDLSYYQNLPYKIEIKKIPDDEGGGWGAFMPEFNGVALFWGDGESRSEAIDELEKAFNATIETLLENGDFIPEPSDKKVRINLPKSLVDEIDKVSKNRLEFIQNAVIRALNG